MSYNFNSYVNRDEANALKEMIFNRARERALSLEADVQSDVMDVARESFVSKNNPFSQIVEDAQKAAEKIEKSEPKPQERPAGIGFPQRELKARAVEQGRMVQEQLTSAAIRNTMDEAREGLSNRKGFMAALNFLNSQAAVSLHRTPSGNFNTLA